jgi:hypothetical protein
VGRWPLNDDLIWFKSSGICCWEHWQTVYDVSEERVAFVVSVVQHTFQSQTKATNTDQEKNMGHYILGNLRITVFFKFWSFFLDGSSNETAFSSPLNFRAKYTLLFYSQTACRRTDNKVTTWRPTMPPAVQYDKNTAKVWDVPTPPDNTKLCRWSKIFSNWIGTFATITKSSQWTLAVKLANYPC